MAGLPAAPELGDRLLARRSVAGLVVPVLHGDGRPAGRLDVLDGKVDAPGHGLAVERPAARQREHVPHLEVHAGARGGRVDPQHLRQRGTDIARRACPGGRGTAGTSRRGATAAACGGGTAPAVVTACGQDGGTHRDRGSGDPDSFEHLAPAHAFAAQPVLFSVGQCSPLCCESPGPRSPRWRIARGVRAELTLVSTQADSYLTAERGATDWSRAD